MCRHSIKTWKSWPNFFKLQSMSILAIHRNRWQETVSVPKCSLTKQTIGAIFWELNCSSEDINCILAFNQEWPIFSQQNQYITKGKCCENYENNHLMVIALIHKQILITSSSRKCMEISLENLYLDIGGLKGLQKIVTSMTKLL